MAIRYILEQMHSHEWYSKDLPDVWVKKLDEENMVWVVCEDESTVEYQEYLAWVAEGNTAEEWQPESEGN
jgi:hypothetical protein